jgi:hypothetical protein
LQQAGYSGGEKKETSVEGKERIRKLTAIVLRTINSGRHISVTAYHELLFYFII